MSRLTLQDSRRLKFTVPALLDAALTFDREHNGWLWRASDHSLVIDAGGAGAVTIRARKTAATDFETVNRSPAWVAAALLQYCFKRRIPIPRHGTKTISVLPDGVVMLVEVSMVLPPLELTRDVLNAAERQGAAAAASATSPGDPSPPDPAASGSSADAAPVPSVAPAEATAPPAAAAAEAVA
jgi:hypothetical protein